MLLSRNLFTNIIRVGLNMFLFILFWTDDIKLFDFGMAKELKPEHKVDDENYRLSFCGSPRYMAPGTFFKPFVRWPMSLQQTLILMCLCVVSASVCRGWIIAEVWAKMPYNSSCDVYSFGVVLYEMIALRRAFDFCSGSNSEEFAVDIFQNKKRPAVDLIRAPKSVKELLPFCWDANPQYRYDMTNVNLTIRKELILLRRGDESTLPDFTRRRSTFIFQQSTRECGTKSRDGSSKSFAESVQSILSAPASQSGRPNRDRKRLSVANLDGLSLSDHSMMNLSLNSVSVKSC
jgi:serine/threonine protein kinase